MDTVTKNKIKAGFKIGLGTARCASAIALACGHGLLAIAAKKPMIRLRVATIMLESGQKTIKEGMNDWEHS